MSSAALATASPDDVLREIRQYAPAMMLYRGHDQWYAFEFGGRTYHVPPDLGGRMVKHPVMQMADGSPLMVKADGILRVKDVYGKQQEKLSRKFTGAFGPLDDQTVSAIIVFAVTNHGTSGVVWLHGDETDEARKKASRAQLRNHLRSWAEHHRDARTNFIDNWKKNPTNAGRAIPRPSNEQRRAQKYLDMVSQEGSEGFEWVCEHGCSDFEEFEDYQRHMKVQHGKTVTKEPVAEVAPEPMVGSDAEPTADELEASARERLAQEAAATEAAAAEKDGKPKAKRGK